ncbi:putative Bric-a-brac protein [Cocos nucifera]|uniref:Putative Bric-a-brac protein n=1 Tax=Cocos nucifera TaxID=13894 RepID=A0A8K0IG16_COCNU|nr:putative Bric-a-brac protein [Cocos nucifera]
MPAPRTTVRLFFLVGTRAHLAIHLQPYDALRPQEFNQKKKKGRNIFKKGERSARIFLGLDSWSGRRMGWCSPSGPKRAATTLICFLTGVALFATGAHLSYVHIAPQQARTRARDEFVREYLRKKYDYGK